MSYLSKRFPALLATAILLNAAASGQKTAPQVSTPGLNLDFPTVLYGAAYYNEYMPQSDLDRRRSRSDWGMYSL